MWRIEFVFNVVRIASVVVIGLCGMLSTLMVLLLVFVGMMFSGVLFLVSVCRVRCMMLLLLSMMMVFVVLVIVVSSSVDFLVDVLVCIWISASVLRWSAIDVVSWFVWLMLDVGLTISAI